MKPKRLSSDELRAIEARAKGVLVRKHDKTVVVASTELAAELAADVPALLAHVAALYEEIRRLGKSK